MMHEGTKKAMLEFIQTHNKLVELRDKDGQFPDDAEPLFDRYYDLLRVLCYDLMNVLYQDEHAEGVIYQLTRYGKTK